MAHYGFDEALDPPAPLLPVRVSGVEQDAPGVLLPMLVDTGADCTLVPTRIARALGLPRIDELDVQGITGARRAVTVYAARVHVGAWRSLARVVAYGEAALLGRDILNQLVLRIDGPARMIAIMQSSRPPRPSGNRRR